MRHVPKPLFCGLNRSQISAAIHSIRQTNSNANKMLCDCEIVITMNKRLKKISLVLFVDLHVCQRKWRGIWQNQQHLLTAWQQKFRLSFSDRMQFFFKTPHDFCNKKSNFNLHNVQQNQNSADAKSFRTHFLHAKNSLIVSFNTFCFDNKCQSTVTDERHRDSMFLLSQWQPDCCSLSQCQLRLDSLFVSHSFRSATEMWSGQMHGWRIKCIGFIMLLNTWLVFESMTNICCALPRVLHVSMQSRFAKRTKQLCWLLCGCIMSMLLVKDTFSDFNKLQWQNTHIIFSSICLLSFWKTIATKLTCWKLLHFLAFSLTVHVNAVVLLQCALSSQFFFDSSISISLHCFQMQFGVDDIEDSCSCFCLSDKKTQMGKFANRDLCENCRSTLPITDGRNKFFTDGRNKIVHLDEAGAVRFGLPTLYCLPAIGSNKCCHQDRLSTS